LQTRRPVLLGAAIGIPRHTPSRRRHLGNLGKNKKGSKQPPRNTGMVSKAKESQKALDGLRSMNLSGIVLWFIGLGGGVVLERFCSAKDVSNLAWSLHLSRIAAFKHTAIGPGCSCLGDWADWTQWIVEGLRAVREDRREKAACKSIPTGIRCSAHPAAEDLGHTLASAFRGPR